MKTFKKTIRLFLSLFLLLIFLHCDDKPGYFVKFSVNGETHTYNLGFTPDANFTGDPLLCADFTGETYDRLYVIGTKTLTAPSESPDNDFVSIYLNGDDMPTANTEITTNIQIYFHDLSISNNYISLNDCSATFTKVSTPGGVCSGIFSGTFPTDSGGDSYPDELEGKPVSGSFRVIRAPNNLL